MTKNKHFPLPLKILSIILAVIILLTGTILIYSANYYHAQEDLDSSELQTLGITYRETKDYIALEPETNPGSIGIILYPGAKVEAKAYLPLLLELAKNGYFASVVKMPLNLAFFGTKEADKVLSDYQSQIEHFFLAGHSLGGVAAGTYLKKNADKFEGLILLASYITTDLSSSKLRVVSIYGSLDGVMNRENEQKNEKNLPEGYKSYQITGGNHAYFANYGEQKGDGTAEVTREYQIQQTVLGIESILYGS